MSSSVSSMAKMIRKGLSGGGTFDISFMKYLLFLQSKEPGSSTDEPEINAVLFNNRPIFYYFSNVSNTLNIRLFSNINIPSFGFL